jgi:HEAT repeat protein
MPVLFRRDIMRALGSLLLDPLYQQDVMEAMQRAGGVAVEHLLGLLIDAPTFAERRALLEALRGLREGKDQLVSLLNHHEWYVVRNVADLAGELGVEAAIDRLGVAVEHPDVRVRRSAGVALAKIGAPAAGKYVRKALRDPDREVRSEVAKAIGGKGFAGLGSAVTAVLETEPDPEVKLEFYRALGRIGTPDMVQFLRKAAESGGLLVGRKSTSIRVAAIQGLALAGGEAARDALRELSDDGEKAIRAEVKKALELLQEKKTRAAAS